VANGKLDAATNNSTSMLLNKENGRPEAGEVRVIWRSPVLPEDPIIWRKDLDPAVKEKLRQFFLTYGQGQGAEAARQRANLARLNVGGFKPADDSHLLPVREMEATEHLIEANQSGDAARIAKAKATLAAITAERVALEARTRAPAAAQ
jgi:phosphonate transport system substrate-binding protein